MSNKKISELTDGGALQATDEIPVERGSNNFKVAGSEFGGSLPDPRVLPTAHPSGATIDTTTYDDPLLGSGKLTTLVFPALGPGEDWGLLAIAIAGDAYPRIIMSSNPLTGTFMSDGTVQPLNNGAAQWIEAGAAGEFVHVIEGGGATQIRVGVPDTNTGRQIRFTNGVTPGSSDAATIVSGTGDPNTNVGGGSRGSNINDLFVRSDAVDVNHWLYRCTTAGGAGVAVWAAVGGLT